MRIVRFLDVHGTLHVGQELPGDQAQLLAPITASGSDSGSPSAGSPSQETTVNTIEWLKQLRPTGQTIRIGQRLTPVDPPTIFCIGLNYREHARETNVPIPKHPVIFIKPITCLQHPGKPILNPACCAMGPELDYECELAIVIGRRGRNIAADEALDYVLGYTCANDVSARRWQRNNGGQWVRGKSFDTFCPLGPVLVTPGNGLEQIADPQNLRLRTLVNGQVMQDSNTSDMIFPIRELISFLSKDTTLLPGTVILTGTPPGVGFARTPPFWLKPGDLVTVEIEMIGTLSNPIEQG